MSRLEDEIIEQESRDYWWGQGEAVMKEMTEENEDGLGHSEHEESL